MSPTTAWSPGNSRFASSTIALDRSSAETSTSRPCRYAATWPGPAPSSTTCPCPATRSANRSRNSRSKGLLSSSLAISSAYRRATVSYVARVSSGRKEASASATDRSSRAFVALGHLRLELEAAGDAGLGQLVWIEDCVDLVLGEDALLDDQLADRLARLDRFLGDVGGEGIADVRRQRRCHGRGLLEQPRGALSVGLDAGHAFAPELAAARRKDGQRLEHLVSHEGHHHVELELAAAGRPGDRRVGADHVVADHRDVLDHHRVDLAGHDRRPRL